MTIADIQELFAYSRWANRKLFTVIDQLPDDAFIREVAGAYGSIRNTLVHIMSTEAGWLERCGGPRRGPRLVAGDFARLEDVVERWERVESDLDHFLRSLQDADLNRMATYPGAEGATRSMPIGELLHHAANHAVHHRAQISLLLREMGHAPGNIDLLFFFAERRGIKAW